MLFFTHLMLRCYVYHRPSKHWEYHLILKCCGYHRPSQSWECHLILKCMLWLPQTQSVLGMSPNTQVLWLPQTQSVLGISPIKCCGYHRPSQSWECHLILKCMVTTGPVMVTTGQSFVLVFHRQTSTGAQVL